MIIVLKKGFTLSQKERIEKFLVDKGYKVREVAGEEDTVLGAVGHAMVDHREVEILPGVDRVIPITKPYKMASREFHPEDSVISLGSIKIGGSRIVTIAGPCAVESRQQMLDCAWAVREAGGVILRGGAYKPRTSPYAFQGLGVEGLVYLREAGDAAGLPVVSEVVSANDVEVMRQYVHMFQIGTRNMQNFELLKTVGATGMPVILKRGMAATIDEWLMAAEYLLSSGTDDVILCERGIRTFGRATRNTLDISAIPVVRELSHLPIIVDPSHAMGIRDMVSPMALASVAAGAHGLIIEVHTDPDNAVSDGPQSLWPQQFEKLVRDIEALCPTVDREMARLPERHQEDVLRSHLGRGNGNLKPRVAFQGERGAYSERAILNYFPEGDVEPVPLAHFNDIFSSVLAGDAQWGMVPIENSLAGSVLENYDLLTRYPDVKIVGEIKIRIRHNLLVVPGTTEEKIRKVYSHPQALSQCEVYIGKRNWIAVPYFDTAGAAGMVARDADPAQAAIASAAAAQYHKLEILAEDIESNPRNYTRFAVVAHADTPEPENVDKVSFTFSIKSHPGALADCLEVLKRHQLDMTKLESRPIAGKPWSYMFYVDVILPGGSASFQGAEVEIQKAAEDYRNLGYYRSA
jgi:3-deoxy-7-phosphoheptulonate synthase